MNTMTQPAPLKRTCPAAHDDFELEGLVAAVLGHIPVEIDGEPVTEIDDTFGARTVHGTRGAHSEAAAFHLRWRGKVWRISFEQLERYRA